MVKYGNNGTLIDYGEAAAVEQWVRTFAPQAEGWAFESQPRQT